MGGREEGKAEGLISRPLAAAKCTGVAPSEVLQVMGQLAERTSQWVTFSRPVWAAAWRGVIPSVDSS